MKKTKNRKKEMQYLARKGMLNNQETNETTEEVKRKFSKDNRENKNSKNNKNKNTNNFKRNETRFKEETIDLENSDYVYGINPVYELLQTNTDINKIWVLNGDRTKEIENILKIAKEQRVTIVYVDKQKIDSLTPNNQGIVASVNPYSYVDVEDILEIAKKKDETPFIVILDKITDSQNLGAIVRSAEAAGVHGIIIPKRNAAQVTGATFKTSAGAINYMPVARVSNIVNSINTLKEAGLWIIGTSLDTNTIHTDANLTGPIALVIGNEDKGVSPLVQENCDMLVKIPMIGKIESLNASVSAGIMIYEVVRQNMKK